MISVIVPVYNVESYLHRCVDSILGQTYADFELILVDDGSPDNCPKICDEYAEKDSRVRVIHQENGGVSVARNTGLDAVQGEYIAFVDSDDWVSSSYLSALLTAKERTEARISVCGFVKTQGDVRENSDDFSYYVCDGLDWYSKNSVAGSVLWGKLYDKNLFESIRFPIGKIHEDEFNTYKLLYAAGKIAVVDAKLYYYYMNETGIMRSAYSVKRLAALEAIEEQFAFFKKVNRKDMVDFARVRFVVESCSAILQLEQLADSKPYIVKTRRKLQIRMLQWYSSLKMTPLKNKWEFSIAFPKLYRAYVSIRNKLRKKQNI